MCLQTVTGWIKSFWKAWSYSSLLFLTSERPDKPYIFVFIRQVFCNLFVPFLFWAKKLSQEGVSQETCLYTPPAQWTSPRPITGAPSLNKRNYSKEVMDSKISTVFNQGEELGDGRVELETQQYLGCGGWSALARTSLPNSSVQTEVDIFRVPSELSLKMKLKLVFGNLYSHCVRIGLKRYLPSNISPVTKPASESLTEVNSHVFLCCKENLNITEGSPSPRVLARQKRRSEWVLDTTFPQLCQEETAWEACTVSLHLSQARTLKSR